MTNKSKKLLDVGYTDEFEKISMEFMNILAESKPALSIATIATMISMLYGEKAIEVATTILNMLLKESNEDENKEYE